MLKNTVKSCKAYQYWNKENVCIIYNIPKNQNISVKPSVKPIALIRNPSSPNLFSSKETGRIWLFLTPSPSRRGPGWGLRRQKIEYYITINSSELMNLIFLEYAWIFFFGMEISSIHTSIHWASRSHTILLFISVVFVIFSSENLIYPAFACGQKVVFIIYNKRLWE